MRPQWQHHGAVGMTFVPTSDVRFNAGHDEATWVLLAGTFKGLNRVDRQTLSDWLDGASGIDTVVDLTERHWNIDGPQAILGVFESDEEQASWLIVGDGAGWTLVRCIDGFISNVLTAFPDILDLIDEQRRA